MLIRSRGVRGADLKWRGQTVLFAGLLKRRNNCFVFGGAKGWDIGKIFLVAFQLHKNDNDALMRPRQNSPTHHVFIQPSTLARRWFATSLGSSDMLFRRLFVAGSRGTDLPTSERFITKSPPSDGEDSYGTSHFLTGATTFRKPSVRRPGL